jgi:hypothetical protein
MDDNFLYHYKAVVVGIYDGNIMVLNIDLGVNMWLRNEAVSLFGVNAPRLTQEHGETAKKMLEEVLPVGSRIVVRLHRDKTGKTKWSAQVSHDTYDVNLRIQNMIKDLLEGKQDDAVSQ